MKRTLICAAVLSLAALGGMATTANAGSTYDWTGAYVGLQGGYSWTHSQSTYDDPDLALNFPIAPVEADGFSGGFEGGLNYRVSPRFVVGFEGDVSFANLTDTIPDDAGSYAHGCCQTITSKTDFGANLRGRAGVLVNPHTLLFAAGGLAISHAKVTASDGNISDDATLYGWTVGGGIEQAMSDKVSAKVEYLYTDTGAHTWFKGEDYSSTSTGSASTVRAGINLHF